MSSILSVSIVVCNRSVVECVLFKKRLQTCLIDALVILYASELNCEFSFQQKNHFLMDCDVHFLKVARDFVCLLFSCFIFFPIGSHGRI